jgi:nucleotide sugar dehydrogenase
MKKIAILGYGVVGRALTDMFKSHYEVRVKDINNFYIFNAEEDKHPYIDSTCGPNKVIYRDQLLSQEEYVNIQINECDLAVIAVPTPIKEDKSCDTSIVEDVVSKLNTPVILIKSTIAPGTTDMLKEKYHKRICFSPEFAGESSYYTPPEYQSPTNMKQHPYVVIGGDLTDRTYIIDLLTPILGPTKKYFQCSAKEAETIKYLENVFFATKVTFANEMKSICDALKIDYYTVREGWLLDPRINPMHTMVFANKRGFSGRCYPKDTNALIQASIKAGYEPNLLKQVLKSNEDFLKMNQT